MVRQRRAVGRPKDEDWRACYAVVDLNAEDPAVEFVRAEYHLDAACEGIVKSSLPGFFAEYLASGGRVASLRPDSP